VYEFKVVASTQKKQKLFTCNLTEIHFDTLNIENPNPGYYIKLETIQEKNQ